MTLTSKFRSYHASAHSLQTREGIQRLLQVSVFEGGGHLHPQAGLAFGNDGIAEGDDHDAELQEALALAKRLGFIADHDGDDRGGRIVKLEAEFRQAFADTSAVCVKPGNA